MKKVHHIGFVVSDIDEALMALGLTREEISETYIDPVQKNRLYFVHVAENDLWFEFVEPTSEDSTTWKYASKNGIGLHHLAFQEEDLEAVENNYSEHKATFALGRYRTKVDSFGGPIKTLFVAARNLILEFVSCRE
jgi:catechol 2,3-dioxygenase-like lactoylglutathione lyase family enzyme